MNILLTSLSLKSKLAKGLFSCSLRHTVQAMTLALTLSLRQHFSLVLLEPFTTDLKDPGEPETSHCLTESKYLSLHKEIMIKT